MNNNKNSRKKVNIETANLNKKINIKHKIEEADAVNKKYQNAQNLEPNQVIILEELTESISNLISELRESKDNALTTKDNINIAELYYQKGLSNLMLHKIHDSIVDFEGCINYDPDNPKYYRIIAQCEDKITYYEKAFEHYQAAISKSKPNSRGILFIYLDRAKLYKKIGDFKVIYNKNMY